MDTVNKPFIHSFVQTGDFCYYAYVSLRVEKRYEDEFGIWNEILSKLLLNPGLSVEDSYKVSNLPFMYVESFECNPT